MDIWEKINGNPPTSLPAGRQGSGNKLVFIIAEIGKNFIQTEEEKSVAEYLENAKRLVDEAVASGADAVKFQTHNVEDEQLNIDVTSPHFKGADRYSWVARNTKATPVEGFWKPLKKYCDERGIIFFSTPMSRGAAKILNDEVGVELWKIGSGDILDFVMLDYLRGTGKPIIISSGMSTLEEVERAVGFLHKNKKTKKQKNKKIVLLHCVSKYPCPAEDLRLGTMEFYKNKFNLPIGFSDHSIGIESSLVAVAMGARVIEKHFSLSRDLWGSDHKVSMTPAELKQMVEGIRKIENDPEERKRILSGEFAGRAVGFLNRDSSDALRMTEGGYEGGNGGMKVLQDGEAVFRPLFRKSLMAGRDIKAGEIMTAEMLYAMRPQQYAGGLASEEYESVLGKKIKKDLKKFEPITKENLK